MAETLALTQGEGVDLAIDAAGLTATRQQAVQVLRPGGTAVFLALGAELVSLDVQEISFKELHLRGSQAYTDADFTHALELLASGAIQTEGLLERVPLTDGANAFATLATDPARGGGASAHARVARARQPFPGGVSQISAPTQRRPAAG